MLPEDYFDQYVKIEISSACALACPKCSRNKPTNDHSEYINKFMSLEDFRKITKYCKKLILSGSIGDPIYHPKFHDILKICKEDGVAIEVRTNGHGKTDKFWEETIRLSKEIECLYTIAIDGLPEDSWLYRRNQDGEAVYEKMKEIAAAGVPVQWQYIVFKYNEGDIETAKAMAFENGMDFMLLCSGNWLHSYQGIDYYLPENSEYYVKRDYKPKETLYPRCLSKKMYPDHVQPGYFFPCCDIRDDRFRKPHLLLSNITDLKKDIFESKEWTEFFDGLRNGCAPDRCKATCGNKDGYGLYEKRFYFSKDGSEPRIVLR